jgi:uncharacterized membrane protein
VYENSKKETVAFIKIIPAGTSAKLLERVKGEGTVEKLTVRFYPGQQKSLQVRAIIIHKGNKIEDLITYPEGGDSYLSGDDDSLVFNIVIPVENDDEIAISVKNIDASNDYTLMAFLEIDYYGGKNRVVGGAL